MERFTGNTNVKPYERLAKYYDWLLSDKDGFDYWLKIIESEPFNTCLELASGSAVMASILKEKGYNVTASDLSPEMKEVAVNNFDGNYLLLDMTNYHLEKKYDLVLCLVDSINYLDLDKLNDFFKCAYEHLNVGGRLIFDSHHISRLDEFKEEYIEEGILFDGIPYQWTISSDVLGSCINEHFAFYDKDTMILEHHHQHVFNKELLIDKMINAYFEVEVIDEFIPQEKMLFIGKKK